VSVTSGNIEDIIEILGNLQTFLREPIIKNKLIDFFNSESGFQLETIELILNSLENIDIQKYQDLISSWLQVLVFFENTKINQITKLFLDGLLKRQELINPLQVVLLYCINKMSNDQKDRLRYCFLETLFMMPNYKNIIFSSLSEEVQKFLFKY
jgi:hypothetical protein